MRSMRASSRKRAARRSDGKVWLDADDLERNDILNLVQEVVPEDSMLVIVVATGAVWQVPLTGDGLLPDGVAP